MEDNEQNKSFLQEISYYKKRVNELSGNTIRLQYQIAEMTNEIEQMKKGFSLISGLRGSLNENNDLAVLYDHISEQLVIRMHFDRSMILFPCRNVNDAFYPDFLKGYSDADLKELHNRQIAFPALFLNTHSSLLVNSQISESPLTEYLKSQFLIPYFILAPVICHGKVNAFILAGRKVERVHLAASRLLSHDMNALEAFAGIISSFILQFEELDLIKKERTRISKELHDDIGAELTRITVLSQSLRNKLDEDNEIQGKLVKISEAGKKVLNSIGEIIWTMNQRNDNLESLAAFIRRFATEYLETNGIAGIIDFPDEIPSVYIKDEIRRNIFLVVKEALHNIIKYSEASKVVVTMKVGTFAEIGIVDDGIGFNVNEKEGWGNGLINMRERMKDIDGEFAIGSEQGKGTRITLKFSLPKDENTT